MEPERHNSGGKGGFNTSNYRNVTLSVKNKLCVSGVRMRRTETL